MNSRLLLVLMAVHCTACTLSRDASSREPFRGYVGQTLALRQPMQLIQRSGYFFGDANGVFSLRPVRYGLAAPGAYRTAHVFAQLPRGHRVAIEAIRDETVVDAYQVVVYGRTTFPATGKETSFAYVYPGSPPLPWETEDH